MNDEEIDQFRNLLQSNNKDIVNQPGELIYESIKDGVDRHKFIEKVHGKPNILLLIKLKDGWIQNMDGRKIRRVI